MLSVWFAVGLTRLELRTDGAAIYPEDNEIVEQTIEDRETFYDPQRVIILVSARDPESTLVTPDGLRYIKELHQSVQRLSGVYGDGVQSLASLLDVQSSVATMAIGTYLDHIPDDSARFAELVRGLRAEPLTEGLYLAENGRHAAIYVPLAENEERLEVLGELEQWMASAQNSAVELRMTGPVVVEAKLGEIVLRDLAVLVPVMVAIVILMLLATLRTVGGVLIPLTEAVLVLLWTFGLMGWVGAPLTLVTTILPVILMTMAITDEIHLLQRVHVHVAGLNTKKTPPETERQQLTGVCRNSVKDIGRPIVVTSITTAIGFLSFLTASMQPMREFGLFTAFGIIMAMIFSFSVIPCLIVHLPKSWFRRGPRRKERHGATELNWYERWVSLRTGPALVLGALIIVVVSPGLSLLEIQDSWVDNFDKQSELVQTELVFNEHFWGSYRFDVVFEGGPGEFYSSRGASVMQAFVDSAQAAPHVGGVLSYLDPFEQVAAGLGESEPVAGLADEEIQDVATVAEMAGDPKQLLQLVNESGSKARATLFVNSPNFSRSKELREFVVGALDGIRSRYNVAAHIGGDIPVAIEVVESIVINQMRSISWTLVGIGILLLIFLPPRKSALIAMIPVMTTAFIVLAAMGYMGMPLGIATSMFASLTIGVGVDFALHFLHNYRRERRTGKYHQEALILTLRHTGRAIRWNASVLVLGFLALTFSDLKPDRDLGILLSGAIFTCYCMTLLFLPKLLRYIKY